MHCSRVDAFRHRAESILVDRLAEDHRLPRLTLTRFGTPHHFVFRLRSTGPACRESSRKSGRRSTMFTVKTWPRGGVAIVRQGPGMRIHTTILAVNALVGFSQVAAQERCPELTRLRSEAAEVSKQATRVATPDRCEAYIRFSMAWRDLARYANDHRVPCEVSEASLSEIDKRHREAVKARDNVCTHRPLRPFPAE